MRRKHAAIIATALFLMCCGCVGKDPGKITGEAISRGNQSICDTIADYRMRYNCSLAVAIAQNDTALCDSINSEVWTADCYTEFGVRARNMSYCEAITSETAKDSCYRKVATA